MPRTSLTPKLVYLHRYLESPAENLTNGIQNLLSLRRGTLGMQPSGSLAPE